MNKYRTLITVALVLAVLFLPYWLYVPTIFVVAIFLPFYWEAVLLGFVIDTLYGTKSFFPAALSAAAAVVLLIPIRERLRLTN